MDAAQVHHSHALAHPAWVGEIYGRPLAFRTSLPVSAVAATRMAGLLAQVVTNDPGSILPRVAVHQAVGSQLQRKAIEIRRVERFIVVVRTRWVGRGDRSAERDGATRAWTLRNGRAVPRC